MIKLAITGKADKRVLAYPFMRACSMAGRTWVVTDDAAYKRLYSGKENYGEIEGVKINVLPTMSMEDILKIEELAIKDETEYLIFISDSYISKDMQYNLLLCEQNTTFLGNYIEDITEDYENAAFGTLTLTPNKNKRLDPKEVHMHQIVWKPDYSFYLFRVEQLRQLLPLKDKTVSILLGDAFAAALNLKPDEFQKLLKRKRYSFSK